MSEYPYLLSYVVLNIFIYSVLPLETLNSFRPWCLYPRSLFIYFENKILLYKLSFKVKQTILYSKSCRPSFRFWSFVSKGFNQKWSRVNILSIFISWSASNVHLLNPYPWILKNSKRGTITERHRAFVYVSALWIFFWKSRSVTVPQNCIYFFSKAYFLSYWHIICRISYAAYHMPRMPFEISIIR